LKHSGKQSYICQLSRNRLLRHDANVAAEITILSVVLEYIDTFIQGWNDLNQLIKVSDLNREFD